MSKRKIAFVFAFVFALALQAQRAVLVAHYGSSMDATREKTIDKITAEIREAEPGVEVREAYISTPVRKNLAKRGIVKLSVTEALQQLAKEGYRSVTVVSTTIIDGGEMALVRQMTDECRSLFADTVKVTRPLLYTIDDFRKLTAILGATPVPEDEEVIFMGHGNNLPSTATYTMLDHMLQVEGKEHIRVSTIEGYPDVPATLALLRKAGRTKVQLYPLLLVCGVHTLEDIDGEVRGQLEPEGIQVTVVKRGLAELPEVRALYVERVKEMD
jgi:sirohydrochlorin cobaltochelatase